MNRLERRFVYGFCVLTFVTLFFVCCILGMKAFYLFVYGDFDQTFQGGVTYNNYCSIPEDYCSNTDMLPDANEVQK